MIGKAGFRVVLSFSGTLPCIFLLTVVPVYAYSVGDIRFPNLMVSDIAAAGPVYKALYTFGFCYNTCGVSLAWTECMRHIKQKAPSLGPSVDRFLLMFHGLGCPCLMLLSAFHFDGDDKDSQSEAWADSIPSQGPQFVTWLVHVIAATFFFLGAAGCAVELATHLAPHLHSKGLMHPADLAWMRLTAMGITVGFVLISIFRCLHIFHSRLFWIWPLAITEVSIILCCVMLNSMGNVRLLADLDVQDPIVSFDGALRITGPSAPTS